MTSPAQPAAPPSAGDTSLFLQSLCDRSFYGTLELKFVAGEIVHLHQTESLKPSSLPALFRKDPNAQHQR